MESRRMTLPARPIQADKNTPRIQNRLAQRIQFLLADSDKRFACCLCDLFS